MPHPVSRREQRFHGRVFQCPCRARHCPESFAHTRNLAQAFSFDRQHRFPDRPGLHGDSVSRARGSCKGHHVPAVSRVSGAARPGEPTRTGSGTSCPAKAANTGAVADAACAESIPVPAFAGMVVHQPCGNLPQEPARRVVIVLVVEHPFRSIAQEQPLPCPCDPDVHQPPLLFQAVPVVDAPAAREKILLHAGNEHVVKFEAFRAVQRHHRHPAAPRVRLPVQVCHQRNVLQVSFQRGFFLALRVFPNAVPEFVHVFNPVPGLVRVLLLILLLKPCLFNQRVNKFRQSHGFFHRAQQRHHPEKVGNAGFRPRPQGLRRVVEHPVKRHFPLRRGFRQGLHRRVADGPLRNVDNPAQ